MELVSLMELACKTIAEFWLSIIDPFPLPFHSESKLTYINLPVDAAGFFAFIASEFSPGDGQDPVLFHLPVQIRHAF
jgi:hypothetical protein